MTVSIPPCPGIRSRDVSSEIAAHLEGLMIEGRLRPGDRLPPERELAATMGVSRSSLRQALFELQSKRLLNRTQGRGSIVAESPAGATELVDRFRSAATELAHASELRDLVEPRIAHLAALRAQRSNLLSLESVLDRTDPAVDPGESLRLDIEFHTLLAHAAQNPLLVTLCTMTTTWTRDTRELSHRSDAGRRISLEGHRRIYAAVERHDGPAAAAAMELHLREVHDISTAAGH